MKNISTPEAVKAFAVTALLSSPLACVPAHAQDVRTLSRIVPAYMNSLKQVYRSQAGQDIITGTQSSPNIANRAYATIAKAIVRGRYDNLPYKTQYELLGCHFQDLSAFSGSLANQYQTNPSLPRFKAPFFAKISQDAARASHDLQAIGYNENCRQIRADFATYLLR